MIWVWEIEKYWKFKLWRASKKFFPFSFFSTRCRIYDWDTNQKFSGHQKGVTKELNFYLSLFFCCPMSPYNAILFGWLLNTFPSTVYDCLCAGLPQGPKIIDSCHGFGMQHTLKLNGARVQKEWDDVGSL